MRFPICGSAILARSEFRLVRRCRTSDRFLNRSALVFWFTEGFPAAASGGCTIAGDYFGTACSHSKRNFFVALSLSGVPRVNRTVRGCYLLPGVETLAST